MAKIEIEDYLQKQPWNEKAFSMPNIPRGKDGVIASLKKILTQIKNGEKSSLLDNACAILRPVRLVVKTTSGCKLTAESER